MVEILAPHESPSDAALEPRDHHVEPQQVRALHVINGEHFAGAERVQDHLAACLPDFNYQVDFVALKPGKFAEMRRSRVALVDAAMRGRFDLRPVRKIAEMVRSEHYALIHTHTPRSAMVGALAAAWTGVPLLHHVHSPTTRDTTRKVQDRINSLIENASLRRVAAAIGVSETMGEYARACGVPAERVFVVPNGVPARGSLTERPTPQGEWTIGSVALFRPRKGLEILLESLARLRAEGLPLRLRAVGTFETPQYESQIMDLVRALGIGQWIDWRGFQRDVHAELAAMDLFVLPSLFGEGLPMVILEAMSAGVPVICTRVEGVPEVIRDGRDGLIAAPGDADDMAAAVRRFVEHKIDWQTMRRSAFERQSTRYSDRSMAAGVASVYDKVLGRPHD
jgi:glycosyltransferase involved in cell wall biosynthesis